MADRPKIAQRLPYTVELEEGRKYAWCACGLSQSQPFCDGSHKGSAFSPIVFTAEKSGTAFLCGCKHSKDGQFCDGTHKGLM